VTVSRAAIASVLLALVAAAPAAAQTFPARSGESGLLDVPDAEVMAIGLGLLGAELRFDQPGSGPSDFGPLPLYAVAGLFERMEAGLSMREWGQPGDPRPSRMLFGAALKLQLVDPSRRLFGIAVDAVADRLNGDETFGGRVIASTQRGSAFRFAAFAGGEIGTESGVTYGGALSFAPRRSIELVLEGIGGPRGPSYGGAMRWGASPTVSLSAGLNYLPDDDGFRVSLGVAFVPARKREAATAAQAPEISAGVPALVPEAIAFLDERPRFRLKIRTPDPLSLDPRTLRHAPLAPRSGPSVAVAPTAPSAAGPARPAAPSLEDLADAQLGEQEALAEARGRRIRTAAEQLDAREAAARQEAARLDGRERELAAREQQLDVRESMLPRQGLPTQEQRQLESLEAQLAAQERQLSAIERSYGPALDAAQGRARDAAAREEAEASEADRLARAAADAPGRAQRIETRKQALGARNRQLAAREARLVAQGERIDAVERTLRTRGERLDARSRRLDTRGERLDGIERRMQEQQRPASTPPVRPPAGEREGAASKDKPVFVMIVKSPTAILKERADAPAARTGTAIHPGVAVEKAVAAAAIVLFPTPASQISELDRETIDRIAKLAARESCELLVWARAKDPSLMGEAQRRASEVRSLALAAGPLSEKQIVTRVTMRPGAQGVDIVVSALRETARPAAAPATAGAGPSLQAGEGGHRQIRDAVQAAQASIEGCVSDLVERKRLQRAEGVLKLTISRQGRVVRILTGDGDLTGPQVEECLTRAASGWSFPAAEAEYGVDVPITVIRGGAAR